MRVRALCLSVLAPFLRGRYEPKYGEGALCSNCHVIIPHSHFAALPPKRADEEGRLAEHPFPEDVTDTSRLACQVTVTPAMHGMVGGQRYGDGPIAVCARVATQAPLSYLSRLFTCRMVLRPTFHDSLCCGCQASSSSCIRVQWLPLQWRCQP
jgi:hypothetical protein